MSEPKRGRPFRALIRRFRKNDDGATAVEFAMVSVPFLGLLFAIFETAFVFFVTEALESAVQDSARQLMTGQKTGSSYANAGAFRTGVVCNYVPAFLTCSNLSVDVRTAGTSGSTTFSGASSYASTAIDTSATKYCPGNQGDVVVMRIMYDMPVYLPMLVASGVGKASVAHNGETNVSGSYKHRIIATAVYRNEPFGTQTIVSGC